MNNLSSITLSRFIFILQPSEPTHLPPFIGSTIRGGFGHTLKSIVCLDGTKACIKCTHKESCPYHQIFEPSPPPNATRLTNLSAIPRPFVISPLVRGDTRKSQDPIPFKLTLVGNITNLLPYFILAFKELGEVGMGRIRSLFILENVSCLSSNGSPARIYSYQEGVIHDSWRVDSFGDILVKYAHNEGGWVKLIFHTPTRIKHGGIYEAVPQFEDLIRALLRRIIALAYFYCDMELDLDYRGIIERATEVDIAQEDLRWEKLMRRSARQGQRVDISGFAGEIKYVGKLKEFLPLLKLGELVGVGKGTTYGLGRYEMRE